MYRNWPTESAELTQGALQLIQYSEAKPCASLCRLAGRYDNSAKRTSLAKVRLKRPAMGPPVTPPPPPPSPNACAPEELINLAVPLEEGSPVIPLPSPPPSLDTCAPEELINLAVPLEEGPPVIPLPPFYRRMRTWRADQSRCPPGRGAACWPSLRRWCPWTTCRWGRSTWGSPAGPPGHGTKGSQPIIINWIEWSKKDLKIVSTVWYADVLVQIIAVMSWESTRNANDGGGGGGSYQRKHGINAGLDPSWVWTRTKMPNAEAAKKFIIWIQV